MAKERNEYSFSLPHGIELVRLAQTKDGWEATVVLWGKPDKWGIEIPSQFGYAFKGRAIQPTLDVAVADARNKFNKINSARRDPKKVLTPEEQMLEMLGLL